MSLPYYNDEGEKIIQTNDGGYIISGWLQRYSGDIYSANYQCTGETVDIVPPQTETDTISQLITSLLTSVLSIYVGELLPTLLPFFFH